MGGSHHTRFHVKKEGAVTGRGLFAARDYARGENVTVYMGADLGAAGSAEGERARRHLAAIQRADHVMEVKRAARVQGRVAMRVRVLARERAMQHRRSRARALHLRWHYPEEDPPRVVAMTAVA